MALDIDHLKTWIGARHKSQDVISPRVANSLAAVLDEAPTLREGDTPPAGIHWCLSPDIAPMSGLGSDGHPARGEFLPPVPLPRRMWAGGQLTFSDEFRVGDQVTRHSHIIDVTQKMGRSGILCFVTVAHDYIGPRGPILNERQDIVYCPLETAAGGPSEKTLLPVPERTNYVEATPILLARYSAATFNGHRIHYDRDYCQKEEGYPGLLVHGPLQATLLLRLTSQMNQGRPLASFKFRGVFPLFDGGRFSINAAKAETGFKLWVHSQTGNTTMQAKAH